MKRQHSSQSPFAWLGRSGTWNLSASTVALLLLGRIMSVVSGCRYVKLEGTSCFIAGFPEQGALASAPVAQGQCQGPSFVLSFHSAVLGVLFLSSPLLSLLCYCRSHRSRRQWAAMVERVSICYPWLLSEGWKFQNPSKLHQSSWSESVENRKNEYVAKDHGIVTDLYQSIFIPRAETLLSYKKPWSLYSAKGRMAVITDMG